MTFSLLVWTSFSRADFAKKVQQLFQTCSPKRQLFDKSVLNMLKDLMVLLTKPSTYLTKNQQKAEFIDINSAFVQILLKKFNKILYKIKFLYNIKIIFIDNKKSLLSCWTEFNKSWQKIKFCQQNQLRCEIAWAHGLPRLFFFFLFSIQYSVLHFLISSF